MDSLRIPLFSAMSDEQLGELRALAQIHRFQPVQKTTQEFHLLLSGEVEFVTRDSREREVVLEEFSPGRYFGELSLLTSEPGTAWFRAKTEVETLGLSRERFNEFLLRHPAAALDVLSVVAGRLRTADGIVRTVASRNVNQLQDEGLTRGQRAADRFAALAGSWTFILLQSLIILVWILVNTILPGQHWDPYPFIFLNLALSFQSAYAAPVIMMSQNRQNDKDRLSAEIDHQVNSKAEYGVAMILRKAEKIEEMLEGMKSR